MSFARAALRRLLGRVAARAARSYIAGAGLADAARVCGELELEGLAAAIGYWNRVGEPAPDVCAAVLAGVERASGRARHRHVSIKVPAMDFREDLVVAVARAAARRGVRVHFDSHGPDAADRTFALARVAHELHPAVGCTLPARWGRSVADAAWVTRAGLYVRVVKGQWPDGAGDEREPREGFLALVRQLAGRARHVGVATHDAGLAGRALDLLRSAGTPCELELLYGLPRRAALAEARRRGVAVRMYVPYGDGFLPYSLGYLRRNPRVAWWLLRDFVRDLFARPRRPAPRPAPETPPGVEAGGA
jgi:proline dehydrogenase